MPLQKKTPSISGFYRVGLGATVVAILGIIATTPFLMVMRHVLTPISQYLDLKTRQRPIPHSLETKAKQRLINLPFIMAPVIISLWIFIPIFLFGGLFVLDIMDSATALALFWQVDSNAISAKSYAQGVLIFSMVVFILFFFGSSILNRLISRSIALPIIAMLKTMKEIKKGNYQARVPVVSNDEVGILGDATNKMIQGLEERELLRNTFGKYVAPEVRDEILSGRVVAANIGRPIQVKGQTSKIDIFLVH